MSSSCTKTEEGIKIIEHKTPSKEIWLNAIMTRQSSQADTMQEIKTAQPVDRESFLPAVENGRLTNRRDRMTDEIPERLVIEQILLMITAQIEETECSYVRNELCHICGPGGPNDKITMVNWCARLFISHSFCQHHFDRVSTSNSSEGSGSNRLKCPVCSLQCSCDKCTTERNTLVQRYREWGSSNQSTQSSLVTQKSKDISPSAIKRIDVNQLSQTEKNDDYLKAKDRMVSKKVVSGARHNSASKFSINALCSPNLTSYESTTDESVKAEEQKRSGHSVVYVLNSSKQEQKDNEARGKMTCSTAGMKSSDQSKIFTRSSSRINFEENRKKFEVKKVKIFSSDSRTEVPITKCKLRRKTSESIQTNYVHDMRTVRSKRDNLSCRDADNRDKPIPCRKRSRSAKDTPGPTSIPSNKTEGVIQAKSMVDQQEDSSDEHDTNLDYCSICLKDGDFVCCDICPRSFHLECLRLRQEDLPKGEWQCEGCKQSKSTPTRFLAEISEKSSIASKCRHLILCLSRSSLSKHFQQPVDDVPNYRQIIAYPMDFSTISRKIRKKMYEMEDGRFDLEKFANDVRLIWSNCRSFNDEDSGIVRAAEVLERDFERLYASVVLS
uniref:Uncharacterized protein AlNc14C174G8087 n=1 Tax=Albugo laibachii Nc14 TaxID=890382 RepID=F0WNS8_9STRA|nr:conserved hypothetical protein [Albugo laibachii Nc14]|eukprot:CCA22970.1 conserved hypothetical protein [Albugo laibachii Nc14]